MATSTIDLDSFYAADETICHRMPCTIHRDGEAHVEKYFLPATKQEKDGYMTSSFRGRPLAGQQMNLPKDYIGLNIVCDDESQSTTEKTANTTWKVKQTFDKFTYWNWDKIPSANDKTQQVFTWLDIANAINGDILTPKLDEKGDTS